MGMETITSLSKFAKGAGLVSLKKTNNCIIYTRVSTKEQADNNLSLETQKKGCEAYVLKLRYDVLAYFGGTYESAATDDRAPRMCSAHSTAERYEHQDSLADPTAQGSRAGLSLEPKASHQSLEQKSHLARRTMTTHWNCLFQ